MIYSENNKEINMKIALDLAQKRFNNISEQELEKDASKITKEYKKFIIDVLQELEQYDTENNILDYIPSI